MSPESSPAPGSSGELIRRAQDGDRAAFDALIRRSQARLARVVRARMGGELRRFEQSDDVVQSVLAEAIRALPQFEYRGEGSFLRWLATIVENKIRHHVRDLHRQRRQPPASLAEVVEEAVAAPGPTASQVVMGNELEERFQQALATLAEPDRELLLLHLELGCSQQEIADALGIVSSEAVRKRIARALVRIEAALGGSS